MNILLYALLWLSFGLGHSITAKLSVQSRLAPVFRQYYRLCYNVFAAIHILAVLLIGTALLDTRVFPMFSNVAFFMNLVQIVGFLFILLALRQYDLKEFSGLSALLNRKSDNQPNQEQAESTLEALNTDGLNGWMRHPLYSGAFVFLWGGADSQLGFFTALFGSLYLLIGSMHEEKKLVSLYGDAYRDYQNNVPRFLPSLRF